MASPAKLTALLRTYLNSLPNFCPSNESDHPMIQNNLLVDLPQSLAAELTEVLARSDHVRIERIISTGHSSPKGFWYDQDEHEWVIVLAGEATLRFEGDEATVMMMPGDHINIPAGRKHRVDSTSSTEPTVWLAVFYK